MLNRLQKTLVRLFDPHQSIRCVLRDSLRGIKFRIVPSVGTCALPTAVDECSG